MSLSEAWIGVSLDAGKGKWFVQLVGPGPLFERAVLASEFGSDHDDALAKAVKAAGGPVVRGKASIWGQGTPPSRDHAPGGVLAALARCEREIEQLCLALK